MSGRCHLSSWEWAIIVTALGTRIACFGGFVRSPLFHFYRADHLFYRQWAADILQGQWLLGHAFEQGPLYAYLLAAERLVVGSCDACVLAMQLLTGIHTAWLAYAVCRQVFGERAARVAGLLCAVYGPLVFSECLVMKSFLSPWLTTLGCYCALRMDEADRKRAWGWLCGSAACVGLLCLVRENHVLLMIPLLGFVGWKQSPAFSSRWKPAVISFAVCLGMTLPASIHNWFAAKEAVWVTTGGGEAFYMAHGPSAMEYYSAPLFVRPTPEHEHEDFRAEARRRLGRRVTPAESSRFWFRQAMSAIATDPLRFLRLTVRKLCVALNDFEVPDSENYAVSCEWLPFLRILPSFGWFAGLGLLGMAISLGADRRRWLVIGFVVAHLVTLLCTYNFARFRLGMIPLWLCFAAHGAVWLLSCWTSSQRTTKYRSFATLAVATVTLLAFCPPLGHSTTDYEAQSEWFRQELVRRQHEQDEMNRLRLSVKENPRNPSLRQELGWSLLRLGYLNDAVKSFEAAVRIDSQSAELTQQLGTVLAQARRLDDAAKYLERSVKLKPDDANSWSNLGRTYIELAREQKHDVPTARALKARAVDSWREAIRIEPRHLGALYNLADHAVAQGEYTVALDRIDAILQINSHYAPVYDLLERVLWDYQQDEPLVYRRMASQFDRLAVALARTDKVRETLLAARNGLIAAEKSGDAVLIGSLKTRLRLFQNAVDF